MWVFKHDKDATLDYGFDWNPWLNSEEDSITSSNWSIRGKTQDDDPSEIDIQSTGLKDGVVVVWLKGGRLGDEYIVENEIETEENRIDSRSFEVRIVER